ncbi:MAG: endonuclease/exonuclease/phosphatase family protein [Bacteroidales bacterium]
MPKIEFILYGVISLAALIFLALVILTLKDYRPDKVNVISKETNHEALSDSSFSLISWNIGYSGLGQEMSFFYDGGDDVRTSRENTKENLQKIIKYLEKHQSVDFILLQEVDTASRRSYYINQFKHIRSKLKLHDGYFAINYKVPYVPLPLIKPLGRVSGGLATFAKNTPAKVVRHQFPGQYSWPKNLFMLDRCFMVCRYTTKNDKELLVVNTHNSAYDNGTLKQQEMDALKDFVTREYKKGNYIIAGGDWNQFPPGFESNPKAEKLYNLAKTSSIEEDFLPDDWTWAYDLNVPTNRSLDAPLNPQTDMTVIDFFLLSPNVRLKKIRTDNLNFKNSDHQPVRIDVELQ